jgi:hypothetical protein
VPARYYGPDYVKHSRWRELWQMSARLDYAPIVHVEAVYSEKHKRSDRAPLGAVVPEAAKYIAKASDVVKLGPYVAELHDQLKGLRMIQASKGLSSYVKNEDVTEEEMLDAITAGEALKAMPRVVAKWNHEQEQYEALPDPDAHEVGIGQ